MTQMANQLDVIERIMEYFSEDCIESCKKIIEDAQLNVKNILENDSKKINFSASNDFFCELTFIRILLQSYEKLCVKNTNNKSINLLFKSILQNIKDILKNEKFDSIKNEQQQELNSVIYSIFKIAFFQNNVENFHELGKFYIDNLNAINQFQINNNEEIKKLNFLLKILSTVYESLELINENSCRHEFLKTFFKIITELKTKTKIEENKIFIKLLLYECDEIAIQTLLLLMPQFIKSFKCDVLIDSVWEEITNLIEFQNDFALNSRILLIMCYLIDFCIGANKLLKKKIFSIFLCDIHYWHLIQFGLCGNLTMRKQSMYLFKKTIELLKNNNEHVICINENKCDNSEYISLWWDDDLKKEFFDIYEDIILILEFLDEQQVHLIKPIFGLIEDTVQKISKPLIAKKFVSLTWILLIYQRTLLHESTQVVKWGFYSFLKAPENFFLDVTVIRQITSVLVTTLNNTSLYYQDGLGISQGLIIFFEKMAKLETSKTFFSYFIQEVCIFTWSPEALFFVTHALAHTPKQSSWQYKEIMEIKTFIPKACRTHKKIIRCGIETEFLNSIITLIDKENVSLKNFIFLLTCFTETEILLKEKKIHDKIIDWLQNNYSPKEAMICLEENFSLKAQEDFNEKCYALMITLFFDAFENNAKILENTDTNNFIENKVSKMLSSFKNIEKRMYCDVSLCNKLLIIVYHLLNFDLTKKSYQLSLLKILCLYIDDIITFIFMQIQHFSNLQDFYLTQIYVKTYEKILKCEFLFNINSKYRILEHLSLQSSQDLKNYKNSKSNISFIQIYFWMELLKITFNIFPFQEMLKKFNFLKSYLMTFVNEPLTKNEDVMEKTRDLQVLWGKMNSDFLACKWEILKYFIQNEKISSDSIKICEKETKPDILLNLCLEALTLGGFDVLSPVISVFQCILPMCNELDVKNSVNFTWNLILERKKIYDFKILIKKFVEMLFQKKLMEDKSKEEIFYKYVDLIFAESSVTVVNILIQHIQSLGLENNISPLLANILAKSLIYGPPLEKNEKLLLQVCKHIKSSKICNVGNFYTSNEVRARSVEMLLNLKKDCSAHQIFAQQVVIKLLEEENNFNKGKIRYFTDSHVHRIKHRVMQGLLLLEPIINTTEFVEEKLLKWLYNSLLADNPQTSVKYQLEWLLVKIIMKNSSLLNDFWLNFDLIEIKTKSMCSLISVLYHLSKVISIDLLPTWLNRAIPTLLPLCMDQHFELRLYAQVVLLKLFKLVKSKNLSNIVEQYEVIYQCIVKNIKKNCLGNAGRNCSKLQEDFYFNVFDPIRHYSLETLYLDLPRLTNVGSDEWISSEIFLNCGVKPINCYISLKNENHVLAETSCATWSIGNAFFVKNNHSEENNPELLIENFQKKIIPTKLLTFEWNESYCGSQTLKKDGLIVVASLIDRIPNLGGLARTCEIFGAFEFIVSSLKFLEDKQFKSLSVTAEKWVSIKEVKVQNLLNYLLNMKKMGYTIIGAEQALHCQPLNLVKFPKKSLLLLGNEKEGIPANLLPWLDICVEIPQVGVIRSLNVHVSGALFIWEYAKQNYFL